MVTHVTLAGLQDFSPIYTINIDKYDRIHQVEMAIQIIKKKTSHHDVYW